MPSGQHCSGGTPLTAALPALTALVASPHPGDNPSAATAAALFEVDPNDLGSIQEYFQKQLYPKLGNPSSAEGTPDSAEAYARGLAATAKLHMRALRPGSHQRLQSHLQELQDWLVASKVGRSVHTCSPEDLSVYLLEHWLGAHQGSRLPNGDTLAADSSVRVMLSNLSTAFKDLGREGEWNQQLQTGNPVHSQHLRRTSAGYADLVTSKGFRQTSATPLNSEQAQQLLQHMYTALQTSTAAKQTQMLRDGTMMCLLWVTKLRPANIGHLRLQELKTQDGRQAAPADIPEGGALYIQPLHTKTNKRPEGRILMTRQPAAHMCGIGWLQTLLAHSQATGQPIKDHIIRPLSKSSGLTAFEEKGMDTSTINYAVKKHLRAVGIPGDFSAYSFRRGGMQADHAAGKSPEEISAACMSKTPSIIRTRYLAEDRHQTGIKRYRPGPKVNE